MSKVTVSLHGSCIIRDTFEFSECLKQDASVLSFIQNNPPTTLGYNTIVDTLSLNFDSTDFIKTSNCWYKWFSINVNEYLYTHLHNLKSDYLIINLNECAYPFYEIRKNSKCLRICHSRAIKENGIMQSRKLSSIKYETIFPLKKDVKYFFSDIDNYCENISKIYNQQQIIIIITYPSKYYITNSNQIKLFCSDFEYNNKIYFLKSLYNRFIYNLNNVYIIKVPENCTAEESHKWGLGDQHYTRNIYKFIASEVHSIIRNNYTINKHIYNYNKCSLENLWIYNNLNK